jgi:sugar/nucleoside kinase (ribokinase family)
VHLAPIAGEVDASLVNQFANSLIGLTPQGWLRTWHRDGRVYPGYWQEAQRIMPLAAAVVLSEHDLADRDWLRSFRKWAKLLVLTQGAAGCTVYVGDEERHFSAPEVEELDPTGAGDVFAAAYFVRLFQTRGNPWEAAQFANRIAALSVTGQDLPSKVRLLQRRNDL